MAVLYGVPPTCRGRQYSIERDVRMRNGCEVYASVTRWVVSVVSGFYYLELAWSLACSHHFTAPVVAHWSRKGRDMVKMGWAQACSELEGGWGGCMRVC
jgi:hypothetical protein